MRARHAALPIMAAALVATACDGDISGAGGGTPPPGPDPVFTAEVTGTWDVSLSGHEVAFDRQAGGWRYVCEWYCAEDAQPVWFPGVFRIELNVTRIDGRVQAKPYSRLVLGLVGGDSAGVPVPGTYLVGDGSSDQPDGSPIASVWLDFPRLYGSRSGTVEVTSVTLGADLATRLQGTFAFDILAERDTVHVEGAFDVSCGPCYTWFTRRGI